MLTLLIIRVTGCALAYERREAKKYRMKTIRNNYSPLIGQRSQHEFRKNFFTVRVTSEWNRLPDGVKQARKVADFKRLYRRHRADTVAPASENR